MIYSEIEASKDARNDLSPSPSKSWNLRENKTHDFLPVGLIEFQSVHKWNLQKLSFYYKNVFIPIQIENVKLINDALIKFSEFVTIFLLLSSYYWSLTIILAKNCPYLQSFAVYFKRKLK